MPTAATVTSEDAPVTGGQCHTLRSEIFAQMFPRWVLIIIGGGIIGAIVFLGKGQFDVRSDVAVIRAEMLHVKEAQADASEERKEQAELLRRIDKAVNGRHEK